MGGTYTPITPRFRSKETGSTAFDATGSTSVTLTAARDFVVVVATAAAFVAFDQAAGAVAGANAFPIPANTPVTFYGPINAVHVRGQSGAGTLVVYAA